MDENELYGKWQQLRGDLKKQWGKLTDDDLLEINGSQDMLIGKLQERYGFSRSQAEKQYLDWMGDVHGPGRPPPGG